MKKCWKITLNSHLKPWIVRRALVENDWKEWQFQTLGMNKVFWGPSFDLRSSLKMSIKGGATGVGCHRAGSAAWVDDLEETSNNPKHLNVPRKCLNFPMSWPKKIATKQRTFFFRNVPFYNTNSQRFIGLGRCWMVSLISSSMMTEMTSSVISWT